MSTHKFISGFMKGFKAFGHNVSAIVNSVLLSIVYFGAVGLTSLVARIKGKHFLETKLSREAKSYWHELPAKKRSIDDYYRQF